MKSEAGRNTKTQMEKRNALSMSISSVIEYIMSDILFS